MQLKKGLNVSPYDQNTVGYRGGKQLASAFIIGRESEAQGTSSALGRCRDTVPPPEGRISTRDQTDLLGWKGFFLVFSQDAATSG